MVEERPAPVLITAAWQVLLAAIACYKAYQFNVPLYWIALLTMAGWHLATALGLYNLQEWARKRAVQIAVFDMVALFHLFPHPYPLGILFKVGMPLYTITVLTDRRLQRRFS